MTTNRPQQANRSGAISRLTGGAIAALLVVQTLGIPPAARGADSTTEPTPAPSTSPEPSPAPSPSSEATAEPSVTPTPLPSPEATPTVTGDPSESSLLELTDPVVFDNFNRTRTGPTWGTASSGAPWQTFNQAWCTGVTTSVNGSAGVVTGSPQFDCGPQGLAKQYSLPPFQEMRHWDAPSWELSARFQVTDEAGTVQLAIGTQVNQLTIVGIDMWLFDDELRIQGSDDRLTGLTLAANTWYAVRWVVVWGDQTWVKVWPQAEPEPTEWLTGTTAPPNQASSLLMASFGSGGSSVHFDDFTFGPAPAVLPSLDDLPEEAPPAGTEDNPPYENQESTGDPVSRYTGALSDTLSDVSIPGRGPTILFNRSYNSNDTRTTTLGPGWTHSYNMRLVSPGDSTSDITLVGPGGRSDRYERFDYAYKPPLGVDRSLIHNADRTWTAKNKTQTSWLFDASGRLTQIRDRYGNASNLTYNGSGKLSTISDPAGRGNLTLGYDGNGRLATVTDWASPARLVTYQYDANGRLWKVTDRESKTTTFGYVGTSHRLATITDARGNVTLTNTYDAQGRVATQKDARGLTTGDVTSFGYVVNGDGTRVTTLTLPTTSFEPTFHPTLRDTYDANGWLTERRTTPSSTETLTESFGYDGAGNRTSVIDARGNRTDFCYDVAYNGSPISGNANNLSRIIAPAPIAGANRPTSLVAYDAKDNVVQTVPPKGVPSGTTVTCSTDLSAITSAYATDYTYDAAGVALVAATKRFTDPDTGSKVATTKYEYGDAVNPGLITRIIPPRGNTGPSPDYTYATTMSYYASGARFGLLKEATDAIGNKTVYDYDAVGRITSIVDPLGNMSGGVAAEHTATYTYDKEDRVRFVSLPAPTVGGSAIVSEVRYNEVGKPVAEIDAGAQVRTYSYDVRNSLFQVKESPSAWNDPASPPGDVVTTEYRYDAGGNVTRVTRVKGSGSYERATDYVFDGRGLVRSEKQYPAWPSTAGPLVSTNTYDAAANPLTAVDPLGQTTTFGFDALNRLSSIDYSDAATSDVAYGYDAHGNRTSMNDGTGASSYGYDETDRLVSVSTPGPKTVGYRYDLDGNRAKLIYPDATTVAYSYDKASRMTSLLDWASRSVSYTYWPDSLLKTATNPDASVATYTYDNSRRLIDIYHARLGTTIERSSYGLDPVGNVTGLSSGSLTNQLGRPDGVVSSGGTWTGTYSDINEITPNDATFLASPASPTTSHFYEASITDIAPPFVTTGTTFRYRYAKDGNNSGKTTNLIVELRQGTTVIASQTHNNIPGVDGSGWQQAGLTLNAAQAAMVTNVTDLRLRFRPSSSGGGQGRKAQVSWAEIQLPGPGDPSTLFSDGYDRLSRITSAAGPDGPRSYAYDPVGNRLGKVVGASTAYTYDRADRLLTVGGSSVTVDANGNLTARGSDAFGFDQANRLSNATVGGTTETYVYDGDGVRFSRQAGASPAVRYVSDVARILPTTIDDGTRKYVYGLGLAYAVSGSTIEVFHADRLGSVRAVTNASGTVTATGRFDEWGVQTQSSGGSGQPFSFTGEPRDPTGLTYLRSRYYDPSLGRFISRDTWSGDAARPQSQNRFAYPNNNPTTLTDPSGHCGVDLVADLLFTGYDLIALVTGPEKDRGFNTAMLAADGLLLFVPCATGGGMLLRAGDEAAGLLDDAAQGAAESCLLRSFTGDTLVATPDGHVPISTIEVGDIVLAWDEATGEVVERSVIAVLPHPDDEIAKVTIDGMVLNTTPDHVFYALEDGWVEVGRLTSGARVKALSGSGHLQHVAVEPYAGTLWDLTVAGAHNFFVGKGQWLVHNMCPMPGIPDWVRSAGGTVSWAKNFEKAYKASGEIPSVAQVDQLVETARTHGVDVIRLDPPHPGTPWDVPHLKIGDAHVPVPEGYQLK